MLRALLYHRIEDPARPNPDLDPDLVSASPRLFERHVRYLARAFHPIDAQELLAALAGRHRLPRRALLMTFDDAYVDFLECAWPILRRHRVPVVLFVPTAFVDQPQRIFWWDAVWQMVERTTQAEVELPGASLPLGNRHERLAARAVIVAWLKRISPAARHAGLAELAERLDVVPRPTRSVLSWAQLRQLADAGVTVAAHSQTHELLDQVDSMTLRAEVDGSRDDLARELGASPALFAYPNGNFSRAALEATARAGFAAAFTTVHGASILGRSHPLALRRDDGRASLARLALKLSGPATLVQNARHRMPGYARSP